jgi:hypothetical protein
LGIRPTHQVAEAVDPSASPTFEKSWKRFKAHGGRRTSCIKATVILLPGIGESSPKSVIGPLEEQVRNGIEHRILVDQLLLNLDAADHAKAVLVVLENSTRQELI